MKAPTDKSPATVAALMDITLLLSQTAEHSDGINKDEEKIK